MHLLSFARVAGTAVHEHVKTKLGSRRPDTFKAFYLYLRNTPARQVDKVNIHVDVLAGAYRQRDVRLQRRPTVSLDVRSTKSWRQCVESLHYNRKSANTINDQIPCRYDDQHGCFMTVDSYVT